MKWIRDDFRLPIKSWCQEIEPGALKQAIDLANHPRIVRHIALMPDCHQGYGMPIGGVIACKDTIIPNAVGVDIGCGMCAVQTSWPAPALDPDPIRAILNLARQTIPAGEGHAHKHDQPWDGFERLAASGRTQGWLDNRCWDLARRNLGTLGGGNHFIEIQAGDDGAVWLMIHSGSRNLGLRIAEFYQQRALALNEKWHAAIPCRDLAYLPTDDEIGQEYLRHMQFALDYARENRRRIMERLKQVVSEVLREVEFRQEINIHHNYAVQETHFGQSLWVHRKGATAAAAGQLGIIPGSMGTPSYIVRGLGNPESFASCSHGAGRTMGRNEASRRLSVADCNRAMAGVVFAGWSRIGGGKRRGGLDLSEAPQAYKNIDDVIAAQIDLVEPVVRLRPLGVVKG